MPILESKAAHAIMMVRWKAWEAAPGNSSTSSYQASSLKRPHFRTLTRYIPCRTTQSSLFPLPAPALSALVHRVMSGGRTLVRRVMQTMAKLTL